LYKESKNKMKKIKNCSNCEARKTCANVSKTNCKEHVSSKEKPMIYIASALRGDIEGNLKKASEYTKLAIDSGVLPYTPHLFWSSFMDDRVPELRELGMAVGKEVLLKCEAVWVFGKITAGVMSEIMLAKENGIPVYFCAMSEEKQEYHVNKDSLNKNKLRKEVLRKELSANGIFAVTSAL
jgi:hypothetical protein